MLIKYLFFLLWRASEFICLFYNVETDCRTVNCNSRFFIIGYK